MGPPSLTLTLVLRFQAERTLNPKPLTLVLRFQAESVEAGKMIKELQARQERCGPFPIISPFLCSCAFFSPFPHLFLATSKRIWWGKCSRPYPEIKTRNLPIGAKTWKGAFKAHGSPPSHKTSHSAPGPKNMHTAGLRTMQVTCLRHTTVPGTAQMGGLTTI